MSVNSSQKTSELLVKYGVPVLLIVLGVGAAFYFTRTPSSVVRKPPETMATPVIAIPAKLTDKRAVIHGMGLVIPAVQISLKSRVAGEITHLSDTFLPGGRVRQGELIAAIDPADYLVALNKAQSAVEKAIADMQLEEGNQTIAREEVRLLSQGEERLIQATDLLLRKPQLAQAKAALHSVESDLQMAQLDLKRTQIYSPFNAMIKERQVNLGTHVSSNDTVAVLVGTDAYWVQTSIPLDQLSAIHSDTEDLIPAKVISQTGEFEGHLKQITGTLTDNTRMARVIVEVEDPFMFNSGNSSPGLLLDDYVSVEIAGKELSSVVELPRQAVKDNDTVWIFDDGKLSIQSVSPIWKTDQYVYLQNDLQPGQLVITTDLSSPVSGLKLSLSSPGPDINNIVDDESPVKKEAAIND